MFPADDADRSFQNTKFDKLTLQRLAAGYITIDGVWVRQHREQTASDTAAKFHVRAKSRCGKQPDAFLQKAGRPEGSIFKSARLVILEPKLMVKKADPAATENRGFQNPLLKEQL